MCGINAVYKYTGITEADKEKLLLMNSEMHYRGPDDEGTWNDKTCAFAQTRLSIIGLDNGRQPLFNEDFSLVLICNGEIYNYIELQIELKKKGHTFATGTDSETILHLYEEYGVKCLEHLRGMFAFCLYDTVKKQLFVARDRVGEKTLYYSQLTTGFVFSTELKAILHHYIDRPLIRQKLLAESIRYNYPLNLHNTYIEQINRIEPAQYLIIDDFGMQTYKYWQPFSGSIFTGNFEEAKTETLRLMRESVDISLRSDVPVGILLSSGTDSSIIAALAKQTGREVHVITAGYKGQHDCDERLLARRFAMENELIYHEVELDSRDFGEIYTEYIDYIDEPISDIASMSQWALYKKAKSMGFTVLLGGLGGDELFYGYPSTNSLAESLRLSHQHQAHFPINTIQKKANFLIFALKNWKHILYAGYSDGYDAKSIVHWTYEDYNEFSKDATFTINNQIFQMKESEVYFPLETSGNEIEKMNYFEFKYFMTMQCLYLADRLGMGNSLELRSPFVDHKLVEFVFSLPLEMKYKKDSPKYFLKRILTGILPEYILNNQKKGFTPPMSFINELVSNYHYKVFNSRSKFFNSMLADNLLYNNLIKSRKSS